MENKKRVFISYGHNTFDHVVNRLVSDLKKENLFEIFLDRDVLNYGDWEFQITNGIEQCDIFIFLVSKKSTFVSKESHSLDGYCMNELSRAAELKKMIIPVCLDDSYLPLSITRLQRLFLQKAGTLDGKIVETVYQPVYDRLLKILKGEEELGLYLKSFDIATEIQSFDNTYEIGHHTLNFIGRESVFKHFEEWLNNPYSTPIYLIQAAPGVGKTAISAMLTLRYPENIAAIHFCAYNNKAKTDAKNIIKNLVSQLAHRSEAYAEEVRNILKREIDDNELDANRLFDLFILEAGNKVSFDKKQVFVIDALDEAVVNNRNEIAHILVSSQNVLPSWLKFVCTTRPQKDVLVYFTNSKGYLIDENKEDNLNDLEKYYTNEFPEIDKKTLKILIEKTHGSFLYATSIVKSIRSNERHLENVKSFPSGIYEYYKLWFDNIFPNMDDYLPLKKIISLLLVCSIAPTLSFLSTATEIEPDELQNQLNKVGSFFVVIEDEGEQYLKARHKAILDWLSSNDAGDYRILNSYGSSILLKYIVDVKNNSDQWFWQMDPYVIVDYQNCLRSLNKPQELMKLLTDAEYLNACLGSPFYTLYEGLSSYIFNISFLYNFFEKSFNKMKSPAFKNPVFAVYSSPCFIYIFSNYRKQMYNSGLFNQLDKCGFTQYLKTQDPSDDVEFDLGIGQFYYISQHYEEAYKSLEDFVSKHKLEDLPVTLRCEIERMAMLVYRKLVLFDRIVEIGPITIKDSKEAKELYEESLANLTLSKVLCRELKKEESYACADEAARLLEQRVQEQMEEGTQAEDHLFLAEDYRVYADACIWHLDLEKAKENLNKAGAIYTLYNKGDRYFTRFLYTSLFYEIVSKGEEENIMELMEDAMKSVDENKDNYDRGQTYFLIALYYFINNKKDNSYLDLALENAKKAVEIDDKLKIYLEALEAKCLYNLILQEMGQNKLYSDRYNEYTDKWIEYVESFILKIKE